MKRPNVLIFGLIISSLITIGELTAFTQSSLAVASKTYAFAATAAILPADVGQPESQNQFDESPESIYDPIVLDLSTHQEEDWCRGVILPADVGQPESQNQFDKSPESIYDSSLVTIVAPETYAFALSSSYLGDFDLSTHQEEDWGRSSKFMSGNRPTTYHYANGNTSTQEHWDVI